MSCFLHAGYIVANQPYDQSADRRRTHRQPVFGTSHFVKLHYLEELNVRWSLRKCFLDSECQESRLFPPVGVQGVQFGGFRLVLWVSWFCVSTWNDVQTPVARCRRKRRPLVSHGNKRSAVTWNHRGICCWSWGLPLCRLDEVNWSARVRWSLDNDLHSLENIKICNILRNEHLVK